MTEVVKGSSYYLLFTLYAEYILEKLYTIGLCLPKYRNYSVSYENICFHSYIQFIIKLSSRVIDSPQNGIY